VTRRTRVLILGVALVILGALAARLFARLELVEEYEFTPPGPEARSNPLLAAHRFLGQRGISSDYRGMLDDSFPTSHVLLLAVPDVVLPKARLEAIASWVREGGHLIVSPCDGSDHEGAVSDVDRLLTALEITADCIEAETTDDPENDERRTITVAFSGPNESLAVEMSWMWVADHRSAGKSSTVVASSIERDEGRITLLGGTHVFTNDFIHDADHARLLERVVSLDAPPQHVWLVHDAGEVDLLLLLWSWGWPAILPLAAAIGLWLWRSGVRFGPTMPEPRAGSRSLLDHIGAVGALLWRRQPEVLLAAVRDETLRTVALRRPNLNRLDRLELGETLAALGGVRPDVVQRALAGDGKVGQEEFLRSVAALESIRRSL